MTKLVLFNKPYNVLCQFSPDGNNQTLADYIPIKEVYPAGRLDKNSEGLLLLTDDGALQHKISHPSRAKQKYYWVQVEGSPDTDVLQAFCSGIHIGQERFLPMQARCIEEPRIWPRVPPIRERRSIPTTWMELVLQEGKNHQIRRVTAHLGYPTLRLVRHRIANWSIGELQPGEYQVLTL